MAGGRLAAAARRLAAAARRLARAARRALTPALRDRQAVPEEARWPLGSILELARRGPVPLSAAVSPDTQRLRIATLIPSFRRGSGGHATIVRLMSELARRGHSVSLWLEDCEGRHRGEPATVTKQSFAELFDARELDLHTDLSEWAGADVVVATGWQTVHRALLLGGVSGRAYLVQDHEPDFYGASAQALWAAQSYREGLHCIAASPWLAELLRSRYGASTSHFDLAVDHGLYRPQRTPRREELVVFYARAVTPRRAVPLGLLALTLLSRWRPDVEIALFGEDRPLSVPFKHTNLGVLGGAELAQLYNEATVGMVFSLTNPSLIALEMMACELPCVELASESMLATFGADGPLALVPPEPQQLCRAIEELLDDGARRERASREGALLMAACSWSHAAEQVEKGLRSAVARDH